MRRAGCLLAFVLLLSAIGGATLVSVVLARIGRAGVAEALPILGLVAAVGIVLAVVLFARMMRRVGRPMGDIVAAADRVASGNLNARVEEHGPPWLRSVSRAFNSMTAALRTHDEQRRHFMADIAHELRTPLAVMQGRIEGLLDGVYPRDDAQLGALLGDTRALTRLVEDLRTLANAEAGVFQLQKEPTDLALLLHEAVRMSAPEAQARGVELRVEDIELPLVDVDPLRIREVVINLLSNAIRHTRPGGAVTVSARVASDDRKGIAISVRDTGEGIAAEELPRIFDRFYKGEKSGGSGLGLTIARSLVMAHGGDIHAESAPGAGTSITFRLPNA